ncbi:MAG: AbrB/MazE/SpoVT family DNA-binding domain-containing protein [Verrucomicrobiaceae bacterium]|nr:AbrB/MazE/SpoVT family DNA-binding domain-containing protein [Verrucomicrobiaceae bacterium]
MTATLTIDDDGRLTLPEQLKRVFGIKPGMPLRAEVSEGRMEIVSDAEADVVGVDQLVEDSGVLLLPKRGIPLDAAEAIRADRDELASRAFGR